PRTFGACRNAVLPLPNHRRTLNRCRSKSWQRSPRSRCPRAPLRKSVNTVSERSPMLHEFITHYRDAIITRARAKLTDRPWPLVSTSELEHGVPLFLSQL